MSYAKPCKYQCGTQIVWDKFANQFKDNATGQPHTKEVCQSIRNQKGYQLKGDDVTPQPQQQQQTYKVTSPQQQIPPAVRLSTNNPAFEKYNSNKQTLESAVLQTIIQKIDNLTLKVQDIGKFLESRNNPTERDNMILRQKITELEAAYEKIEGKSFVPANQVLNREPEPEEESQTEHDQHVRDMVAKGRSEEELEL